MVLLEKVIRYLLLKTKAHGPEAAFYIQFAKEVNPTLPLNSVFNAPLFSTSLQMLETLGFGVWVSYPYRTRIKHE